MTHYRHRTLSLALFGLAILGLVGAAPTHGAFSPDRRVELTFSRPIALPGVTLAAGTYVFERAAPASAIEVVRVSSRDRHSVYFMGFTELVPPPGRNAPVVTFGEAAEGLPVPIKEWYPDDRTNGHRFIYR